MQALDLLLSGQYFGTGLLTFSPFSYLVVSSPGPKALEKRVKASKMFMGRGKMIVLFLSDAISVSVDR